MGLESRGYVVVTLHRPYNVDVPENLSSILSAFTQMTETVVFPVHPRTRARIDALGSGIKEEVDRSDVRMVDPLGYLDMLQLQRNARLILTDSGGVQKEAYIHGVPCITLRPETEWIETVQTGWNALAGADTEAILRMVNEPIPSDRPHPLLFGDGYSAQRIVERLN
jgi:UDP-N-acetylglucosamine 2-epimerase